MDEDKQTTGPEQGQTRSRREIHEENARLALENAELKQRLAKEVADRGPAPARARATSAAPRA